MAIVPNLAGSTPLDVPIDDKMVYGITFSAVEMSAAQDVFSMICATKHWRILDVKIGQSSDEGDTAAEMLPVQIVLGHTTVGSGGGLVTPVPLMPNSPECPVTCRINDTTIASSGTTKIPYAYAWNIQAGEWHYPPDDQRIWVEPNERAVVRITAPADAITGYGTLIFEVMP